MNNKAHLGKSRIRKTEKNQNEMIMKRQETQEKNKRTKLNKRVFKGANTMHERKETLTKKE
jgi:hypothetical protein